MRGAVMVRFLFYNLPQVRVTWEEETLAEKMPPSDWPVKDIFLIDG